VIGGGRASVHVNGEEKDALGPGDHFGEIAIVADVPRMATVRAETALRCYGLTSWQFRPLVETNAAIAWKVLQAMGKALASRA
jgi:CRP-like cAMP-binding protein